MIIGNNNNNNTYNVIRPKFVRRKLLENSSIYSVRYIIYYNYTLSYNKSTHERFERDRRIFYYLDSQGKKTVDSTRQLKPSIM